MANVNNTAARNVTVQAAKTPAAADKAKAKEAYIPGSTDPATLAGWTRDKYDANKYKTEYRMVWDPEDEEYEYQPVTVTIPRDGQLDDREFRVDRFHTLDSLKDKNGTVSIGELEEAWTRVDASRRQQMLSNIRKHEATKKEGKDGLYAGLGLGGGVLAGIGAAVAASAGIAILPIALGVAAAGAGIFGLFNLVRNLNKHSRANEAIHREINEALNTIPS